MCRRWCRRRFGSRERFYVIYEEVTFFHDAPFLQLSISLSNL